MIKDKVVIITGASSGIGAATAMLLAQKGAKLVLGARREEKLQQIVNKIKENGGEAIYRITDVTNPDDSKQLVKTAKDTFGKVDVIFLNAGLMPSSEIDKLKTDEWNKTVDVNIKGILNGIAAVLPTFKEQNGGHIITTSSVAGLKPYPGVGVYGATKHAVRDLMEVLRMESAQENSNIRTATIYPAAIHTELLSTITDPDAAKAMQANYDKYQIGPDRVANVVAFAIDQPEDTNVSEFTVGPTNQPW
ncbi:SDR family oxidoreductase [Companilactobacillus kimchii]|uniref:Short-chain alcohol dehydrogenase n=2 Tax=Companilactobacillus kimchii TaxID=2801452 RepID=A0ABR5NSH1_9LACO|nr:SDR family oxidoreductase [Companilactobacillus kimchii]KAE9562263.1 oxidoreductase [Companilactobacillus kimchii]KRK51111.1 short-chain alcohol dehydrogenase [Companilactobacillus kimchii DSM 13961 = JCM 10707]OWF34407.1 Cyclopentanol dehydrogenase [Companilactobacillus kimchii]GEO46330.1 oxidoreductase [Companilactobacillus paralimentarius]